MIWGVEEEDIAAAERERREEEEEERGRRRWLGGECLVGENARDNGEENSGRALTHIISLSLSYRLVSASCEVKRSLRSRL